jgi:cell division protein FtsA
MKNPVGMYGARLDLETHIITAAVTSVKNLVKCVRGAKVDVEGLVFSSLASSEAVLTEHEKELGVILADIGGGTTDIAIYKEGSVCHTAVLPVGGYQLTRDISISLGLPTAVAEVAKRKYANVAEDLSKQQTDPVSLSIENGYNIMHQDLYEVVRARMEEIIKLIVMEMPRSEYTNMVPTGLVLTGGTANLPGLSSMTQEMLQIPVRVGGPREIQGLADSLYAPSYATSVGLLMWGIKNDQEVVKLNGRKSFISRLLFKLRRPARPDKKKPYDNGLAKGGNHDTSNS